MNTKLVAKPTKNEAFKRKDLNRYFFSFFLLMRKEMAVIVRVKGRMKEAGQKNIKNRWKMQKDKMERDEMRVYEGLWDNASITGYLNFLVRPRNSQEWRILVQVKWPKDLIDLALARIFTKWIYSARGNPFSGRSLNILRIIKSLMGKKTK